MKNYFLSGVSLALNKISNLFFVRDHPINQKIVTFHTKILASMLEKVKEMYMTNMAGSITGNKGSSQAGWYF